MKFILLSLIITASSITYNLKQTPLEESIKRGSEIYTDFCMNCHLPNGEGVKNVYPPLAKSDFLAKNQEASIRAVKYGVNGELKVNGMTYKNVMAPLGLSDSEVADVMNYINNSWGNKNKKMITKEVVEKIKK
ncbi:MULTISPECIES: c-type cytochrome [Aestuariibaculum]|uniref:Cytochrome c n=1 Tax=Aestuariibaculum marinum TaxID=2683592 RepID=A0A8J6UCJ2_9FLAO|nr:MULTISPECIES: cytochrome c [Aestuariibaculum]MBD0824968.1 cytochrome c [Aestuariibaculum marinum]WMI64423.1 cytochrome c [Aestuariibaculum sp. YM273]